MEHKVFFLDRDGVINQEVNYLFKIKDFIFISGVFKSLNYLSSLGFKFIIVSNQSGISRGFYSERDFVKLNKWMIAQFKKNNIEILDVFICPHSPEDNCSCRKPRIGLFEKALNKYSINISNSWMIGDSERDITAAMAAGITNTIMVRSGHKIDEKNTKAKYIINSINNINEIDAFKVS